MAEDLLGQSEVYVGVSARQVDAEKGKASAEKKGYLCAAVCSFVIRLGNVCVQGAGSGCLSTYHHT